MGWRSHRLSTVAFTASGTVLGAGDGLCHLLTQMESIAHFPAMQARQLKCLNRKQSHSTLKAHEQSPRFKSWATACTAVSSTTHLPICRISAWPELPACLLCSLTLPLNRRVDQLMKVTHSM